jgi:hypothetical protein
VGLSSKGRLDRIVPFYSLGLNDLGANLPIIDIITVFGGSFVGTIFPFPAKDLVLTEIILGLVAPISRVVMINVRRILGTVEDSAVGGGWRSSDGWVFGMYCTY